MSVEGEEAADDDLRSSPETKDCIRDVIVGTSEVACSVQPTEIFIPVPDLQLPTTDMLCHVKVENEDLLREGNFVVQHTPAQNGIESNAIDPLASDDLFHVKEENMDPLREENDEVLHGTAPDGIESDAIDPLTTDALFHVKKEDEDRFGEESYPVMHTTDPAGTLSDISYPLATGDYSTSDEDGEPIESLTIAHKSTAAAFVTNAEKAAVLLSHVENLQPRDMHPMVPVYHGFHVMIRKIDKIECLSRAKNNPGRLQRLLLEKIKGREYIKTHCARGQRATTGGLPAADADVLSAVQLYTESLFKGQKVPSIEKTFNQMSGNIRKLDRYHEGKYRYARKQKKNKNVGDENLRQLHKYGEMSTPLSEAFAYTHGKNHIHARIVKRLPQERAS
ncbi:uncharacterized protein LOC124172804 [Ischnura elegans]|uniref:uncharacterized protein LOC124172804 n=1 Tax=Ischnura elegans TaxID=197161 RepID=UPI001ED877F8|nr:uncharacterized protein LOC124172804 [Ischnura elegans]